MSGVSKSAIKRTEHWSKLKMQIVLPEKMNSIDKSGLKNKKLKYGNIYTFQELVTTELADAFPGKEAIKVYAVGTRITK